MLVSPGTFYRGGALIMASDLAATPRSGITVQLCGDAHLSNFGVFASPERQLIFDINDFDETLPGPWEWDVKRMAASFEIAGRDLGFSPADRRGIVLAGVREYREQLREASRMRTLDAWYAHLDEKAIHEGIRQAVRRKRLGKKEARERPGGTSPRPGPATACGCWPGGPGRSRGSCGSSATPRSSRQSRTCCCPPKPASWPSSRSGS